MTIGIFLNSFCEGGIERVVARLIPIFYQMGYDVVILSILGVDCDVMSDIPYHKRIVIGNGPDRGSRLAAALRDFKIEICIIENFSSPTLLKSKIHLYIILYFSFSVMTECCSKYLKIKFKIFCTICSLSFLFSAL